MLTIDARPTLARTRARGADGLIVLDPNRGDTWTKGGSYSVLWTSMRDDIALCLSVEISLLRGTQPVDSMTTENDGAALFYVSSTVSDGSNYRLSLRCVQPATLRTALVGHSDIFSVESAAEAFSVTAPEAGAAWPVGTERLVRWALARPVMGSEACEEVNVLLIGRGLGSGTEERLVRSVTVPAAAGAEHALYASGDLQPGSYGVRVQCAGDTALGGESGRFQIVPNPSALVLIAPGPSTACLIGHACEVAWTSSVRGAASPECAQLSGALVDGARALLAFRVPNEPARAGKDVGRHALYLPGSLAPTLRAHLELRCARDSSVRASSRPFRVVRDVGALELVEPHAGSVWGSGQTHTARWLTSLAGSANCSAVDVDLLHGGTVRASWPAAANSGSLQIYIPGDSAPAADYAVRIGCAGDASLRATSAPFEVAPDPTALTLTSPAPRARWTAGSVELVAWRASDALRESASCAHVDVAVRRDTVRVHAARVPNNGRYAFYVNASLAPGDDYSIALACAADPAVRAESVAFAVVPLDAPFRFETPTARSEWMRGQSYAVRWASPLQLSDACATVRLELVAELPEPIDFEHAADGRQAPPPAAALEAPNSGRAWLTVGRTAALPAGGLGTARVEISCTRDRALRGRTEAFTVREACSGVGCARPADGSGDDVAETAEWAAALARGGSSAAAGSFAMPTGVAAGADVSPARGGDDGVGARARERDAGAPSAMPLVGIDEEGGGAFDGGGGGGGGGGLGAAMLGARDVAAVRRPCDEGGHVTCGLAHSCALTSSGGLLCWGQNSEGQTDVPPGHTWLQVSAGVTHTCGVTTDRTLECWGGKHRWTPIDHHEAALPGGELWGAVAAGHAFSCALTMSHRLYCWGYGTELGGDRPPRGLLWRSVTVGESHACGVTSDGALACWGNNAESQAAPPERSGEWRMVATHHRHTCGVTADAQLVCWGANDAGQCDVPRGFRWAAASTGHSHSCGLTTQGLMRCWGHLTFGLGNAPPGYRWAELALGMYHACGLVEGAGDVLCWGMDYHGETDVPDGFRFWDGCDNLGSAAARAVESEHKPGKLACPQHELLDTADGFATRCARATTPRAALRRRSRPAPLTRGDARAAQRRGRAPLRRTRLRFVHVVARERRRRWRACVVLQARLLRADEQRAAVCAMGGVRARARRPRQPTLTGARCATRGAGRSAGDGLLARGR